MTDLGSLGGRFSQAFGINDAGAVVGMSVNSARELRAFLWTAADGMRDLGAISCALQQTGYAVCAGYDRK